jgi:hypothetical protein
MIQTTLDLSFKTNKFEAQNPLVKSKLETLPQITLAPKCLTLHFTMHHAVFRRTISPASGLSNKTNEFEVENFFGVK